MIIFEGADHTGKTTLARALTDALPELKYRHMSKPAEDFDHVSGYFDVGPYVQDRYHLGAVVYGRLLDAGSAPTPRRMQLVQRYLRWQGTITVVFHCQRAVLAERLRLGGKREMYSSRQILAANDGYRALINSSNRGTPWADIDIDVTDRFPDIDDAKVQSIIERWKATW